MLPPTSVGSYERGERTISVARLIRLAAVYGVPAECLVADVNRSRRGVTAPKAINVAALEAFEGRDRGDRSDLHP
jgi:transcriptional regulator with XRE-family HTH domain